MKVWKWLLKDPCKSNRGFEFNTIRLMRDSLRDCQTGDIKIKPFLRRQERLRMIFKKTRDAFGCKFQHKVSYLIKLLLTWEKNKRGGGSIHWFTTDVYFEKFGSSYNGGEQFCASRAMRLCTFEEYCPNGEFGETHKTLKSSKWQLTSPEGESLSELYQQGFPLPLIRSDL